MVQVDPQGVVYWLVFVIIPALGALIFSKREAISKVLMGDLRKQVDQLGTSQAQSASRGSTSPGVPQPSWVNTDLTVLSLQTTLSQSDLISRLTQSLLYELPQIRQVQEAQGKQISEIYTHLGIPKTPTAA